MRESNNLIINWKGMTITLFAGKEIGVLGINSTISLRLDEHGILHVKEIKDKKCPEVTSITFNDVFAIEEQAK